MRRIPRFSFEIDEAYKRQAATLAAISRAVGPSDFGESSGAEAEDANDPAPEPKP